MTTTINTDPDFNVPFLTQNVLTQSPYLVAPVSVTRVMLKVLLAMIPGIVVYTWLFGPGILVQLTLATLAALIAEAAFLRLRRRPIAPSLTDLSAVVTAWLIALSFPPMVGDYPGNRVCHYRRQASLWWPRTEPV